VGFGKPRVGNIDAMADDGSGYFLTQSDDGGYCFVLKARNGQVLATSEVYTTKESAEAGIRAVRGTATAAKIIDTTQ
jgi:uncharacterized protein YegP (UPF0339 family)